MSRTTNIAALAAIVAAALAGCATTAPAESTSPQMMSAGPAPSPTAMGCNSAAVQQSVLQRINEARQAGMCGDARVGALKPLTWQPALASTASKRAGEIAQRGSFGNVADVTPRLRQDGYAPSAAQETQVAGDFSSDGAARALLSQHKQCTALLNPAYTDIGAACVTRPGSEFKHYWTVVVAKGTPTRTAMGAGPVTNAAARSGSVPKKTEARKPELKKGALKPKKPATTRARTRKEG